MVTENRRARRGWPGSLLILASLLVCVGTFVHIYRESARAKLPLEFGRPLDATTEDSRATPLEKETPRREAPAFPPTVGASEGDVGPRQAPTPSEPVVGRAGAQLALEGARRDLDTRVHEDPANRSAAVAENANHCVRFDAGSITYTPKDARGMLSRDNWRYETLSISRGRTIVAENARPRPAWDEREVRFEHREGLIERYTTLPNGVEQEFLFDQIPEGRGDLVVTARLDTPLLAEATPNGLVFRDPTSNVVRMTYGRATVRDAKGRTGDVEERLLAGGMLELRVSSRWLETATAPVVIDPLIGSNFQVTDYSTTNETEPCVAYNPNRNEYMVAILQSGNRIGVTRVSNTGTVLTPGGILLDGSTATKAHPFIAYSRSSQDKYLLLYERSSVVYAIVVSWDGTIVAGPGRIFDPTGNETQANPCAAYDASRDKWLMVWDDNSQSGSRDILGRRITPAGVLDASTILLQNDTAAASNPYVAYSSTSDEYLYAYQSSDTNLYARLVNGALTAYNSSLITVSNAANTQKDCAAAWNSSANEFLVVWSDLRGGSLYQIFGQRISSSGSLLGSNFNVSSSARDDQDSSVSYNSTLNQYLVVWDTVATNLDTYGQLVGGSGSLIGSAFLIAQGTGQEWRPFCAWNSTNNEWVTVWQDNRAGGATPYDFWGQRITGDQPPTVQCTDPPDRATGAFLDQNVVINFSEAMLASTINTTNITLKKTSDNTPVTGTVSYTSSTFQATFDPTGNLLANTQYTLTVTTGVQDAGGTPMSATFTASFTTGSVTALADSDGDGLLDVEEQALGTNPLLADTDGDGISDYNELCQTHTDPTKADTDGDGLNDGTDPNPLIPNPGPDTKVPVLWGFFPAKNTSDIALGIPGKAKFDEAMLLSSVSSNNFKATNLGTGQPIPGAYSLEDGDRIVVFTPTGGWAAGITVRLEIIGGATGVTDVAGNHVQTGATSDFTTRSIGPETFAFEQPHYLETAVGLTDTVTQTPPQTYHDGGKDVPHTMERHPGADEHSAFTPDKTISTKTKDCKCKCPCGGFLLWGWLIVPSTGNLYAECTDMQAGTRGGGLEGKGESIHIMRVYRNSLERESVFGFNWTFNYDMKFQSIGDVNFDTFTDYQFTDFDGRRVTFLSSGASSFTPPAGYYDSLKVSGNLVKMRRRDGARLVFDLSQGGLLIEAYDANENKMTFVRAQVNAKWRMSEIVDDLDRHTTFAYYDTVGDARRDLVQSITDWDGRLWSYDYDSNRNLTTVTSPPSDWLNESSVLQTNLGKTTTYSYTSGFGAPRDHSLTGITDGRGNQILRVVYDTNDHAMQFDHAGGTAFYSLDWDASGLSVEKATEIDRAGNTKEIRHDSLRNIDLFTEFTRGFHAGEPPSYVTSYKHNANNELVQAVYPRGNVVRLILDSHGYVRQRIMKTSLASAPDTDIVEDWKIDSVFGQTLRYSEPRGNTPPVASTATQEDVDAQTVRTFTVTDAVQRDAYTRYFFYDHENITNRLSQESTEMGTTVSLQGALPKTYGRPNGVDPPNATVFTDRDGDGLIDHGGNQYVVRDPKPKVVDPNNPSQFQASRQVIEHFHTYNQYGQPIFHIHPDGDRDRFEWYVGAFDLTNNPNRGFLKLQQVDTSFTPNDVNLADGTPTIPNPGTNLDLTTQYAYDKVGSFTSITSPRGFVTTFTVNKLNLVTQITSPAPFSYQRKFTFDGANNLVKLEVQNVTPNDTNDNGIQDSSSEQTVGTPSFFTHTFKFNTANALIEQTLDATGSTPSSLTTKFERDLKQRVVRVRKPEGNWDEASYDERDLVFKTIKGASDTTISATTTYDYDANANLTSIKDDDGNTTATTLAHDLFDRPTMFTSEMGNSVETQYDMASFVRARIARGQKTGASGEPTTTVLAQGFEEFDELGRSFQRDAAFFDVIAGTALQDGALIPPVNNTSKLLVIANIVSELTVYDADSVVTRTIDDNNHHADFGYDDAHRLTTVTDHMGSQLVYTLDKDSNVIRVRENEKNQDTLAVETFYTERFYDELDRPIATVSNMGNTRRFLWDSRNNPTQSSDAMGTQSGNMSSIRTASEHGTFPQGDLAINQRGNTVRHTYDGLSRRLSTIRDMRSDGTGATSVTSTITTSQTWDGNSRLATQTDNNGNVTSYCYDHQDRLHRTTYADGTTREVYWNRVGTVKLVRDPRKVVIQSTYDGDELLTDVAISNIPYGQGQTTFLAFQYDGLTRTKRAEDNDSICLFNFDSLGQTIKETQSIGTGTPRTSKTDPLTGITRDVTTVFDGEGNRTRLTYPSGKVIDFVVDEIDRLDKVKDGGTVVADYQHTGMGYRRVQRVNANGTTLFCSYDGERRITRHDHRRTSDNQRVRGFEYTWDREDNRRYEQRLTVNTSPTESTGPGEFAKYDSIYRLTRFRKDAATAGLDSITNNATSVTEPSSTKLTDYSLDGVGNRASTVVDGMTTTYTMQLGGAPKDKELNQYTQVGSSVLCYDDAGNTYSNGTNRYFWDFADRMVQLITATDDVRYAYDAFGRRVAKRSQNALFTTVLYWCDGDGMIEESDDTSPTPNLTRRYVYGPGIDEVLTVYAQDVADVNNNGNTTEFVTLYYHENSLGSVAALTRDDGGVVEAYRYDAYGAIDEILNKSGSPVSVTQVKNPVGFQGRYHEFQEGSGLVDFRARKLDPRLGRFTSRDPKDVWGDRTQLGNGQSAFGSNPFNKTDPWGMDETTPSSGSPNTTPPTPAPKESFWKRALRAIGEFVGSLLPCPPKTISDAIGKSTAPLLKEPDTKPAEGDTADAAERLIKARQGVGERVAQAPAQVVTGTAEGAARATGEAAGAKAVAAGLSKGSGLLGAAAGALGKRGQRVEELAKGGCEKIAQALLKKHSKGQLIKIVPNLKKCPDARLLGPVRVPGEEGAITEWAEHAAVREGDMIYDALTGPKGMHIDEYKKLFEYADDLLFGG